MFGCRVVFCKCHSLGCPWRGPCKEREEHQNICDFPRRIGADLLDIVRMKQEQEKSDDTRLLNTLFDLLSYEKIVFNGNLVLVRVGDSGK